MFILSFYLYFFTVIYIFHTFSSIPPLSFFFFFNDTATTEIYTLSLHDALPILSESRTLLEHFQIRLQLRNVLQEVAPVGVLRRERHERQADESGAIGEAELCPGDVRVEFRPRAQRADALGEVLLDRFLHVLGHRPAEEHLAVEPACHELDMQLDQHDQFPYLGTRQRVGWVQRLLWIGLFEVLADHLRFRERRAVELEEGHLAHGRARQELVLLAGRAARVLLERYPFLEQRDAHLVVVVADVKAAELEHRNLPTSGLHPQVEDTVR